MTVATPVPWRDLLSHHYTNITDQYGPHSQAVASALMAIGETRWLKNVGEPWFESALEPAATLTVVKSWDEALTIFRDFPRYNINGVLQAACDPIDEVFENHPELERWWQVAREDAKRYSALMGWIPKTISQEHRELIFEHLWEFISMTLAEIIASAEVGSSYFREQLSWFHAGHFPCGWHGDWPSGHARVY